MGRSAFTKNGLTSGADSSLEPGPAVAPETASCSGAAGRLYRPAPVDSASLPGRIKVDLNTPFENLWYVLAGIACFIAFMVFNAGALGGKHTPPNPELLVYLPIPLAMAAIFLVCRFYTDNFYVIDFQARMVFDHFEFFNYVKMTEFISFDNIRAMAVTGIRHQHKGSYWWTYHIALIDSSYKTTNFSDSVKEDGLVKLNEKALGMAAMIGCLYGGCPSRHVVDIRPYANTETDIVYKSEFEHYGDERTSAPIKIQLSSTFWIIAITIIVAFIVMMKIALSPVMR